MQDIQCEESLIPIITSEASQNRLDVITYPSNACSWPHHMATWLQVSRLHDKDNTPSIAYEVLIPLLHKWGRASQHPHKGRTNNLLRSGKYIYVLSISLLYIPQAHSLTVYQSLPATISDLPCLFADIRAGQCVCIKFRVAHAHTAPVLPEVVF